MTTNRPPPTLTLIVNDTSEQERELMKLATGNDNDAFGAALEKLSHRATLKTVKRELDGPVGDGES